jgi:osmotically-inducible protein OsmY
MKRTASIFLVAIAALAISLTSCKKKPNDADIKAVIEKALASDPLAAGTTVTVEKGIATLSGVCKDEMSKAACEKLVAGIKGVKSVVNNCTITPPVEITMDDPLTKAVTDALKAFPGVSATVKDGIISLTGSIAKADRQKLMMALQALKPKKVDPAGLTNK